MQITGDRLPPKCARPDADGTLPTCTSDGAGGWTVSNDGGFGPGGADSGVPAGFVLFALLAIAFGIAGTVWKVSTARRMARESGMSERDATTMALLTDDGFEATYVASNVRGRSTDVPSPAPVPAPAAERLAELRGLLEQGLVTQDEYDAARRRIIDGL